MCLFRQPTPPINEVMAAPTPMQPINPQTQTKLPTKKELVDPDEKAGVEFGTTAKADTAQGKGATGANALRINVNTGSTGAAANQGGVNTNK